MPIESPTMSDPLNTSMDDLQPPSPPTVSTPPSQPFPFLSLPLELRESIYSLYFKPSDRLVRNSALDTQGFFGGVYRFDFNLCHVNKQICAEARRVWKRENLFVKIATPWPSAGMYQVYLSATDADMDTGGLRNYLHAYVNHISSEGLVPIVCTDRRAGAFKTHHALVQITAPFHQAVPEYTVVVLLDDLPLFTRTWYYSALSYPMLNDRLSTTFMLRNPDGTSPSQELSLSLQRRLLLPFEQVKGLYHLDIIGYAAEVEKDLKRRMAKPLPTLVDCCEKAQGFMEAGDAAIISNNLQEALELYRQAFHSIHILIHGRTRRVLADVFFHEAIETGRFAGQTGMTVRLVMRLKLVSRYVLAYLKLEQWAEAAFWGMRSIRIMRESMDTEFEDFLSEFVGGEDVAMIYVRTGIAFTKMEEDPHGPWELDLKAYDGEHVAGSESIFGIAKKYLKKRDRSSVRKELEGFGVGKFRIEYFGDENIKTEAMSTSGQKGSETE